MMPVFGTEIYTSRSIIIIINTPPGYPAVTQLHIRNGHCHTGDTPVTVTGSTRRETAAVTRAQRPRVGNGRAGGESARACQIWKFRTG